MHRLFTCAFVVWGVRVGVGRWWLGVVICGCHSSGIGSHDDQFVVAELVVEAVFVGDTPRPLAGQAMGQGLGRADAGCRVAGGFVDHAVDSLEDRSFVAPGDVVLPAAAGDADLYVTSCWGWISSWTLVRLASVSVMLRAGAQCWSGDRGRWAVFRERHSSAETR